MTTRLFNAFLIVLLCFAAASASFHGFYSKWGMREGSATFGLKAMFDGTADRPWAYRQLMPAAATAIDAAVPPSVREPAMAKLLQAAGRLHFDKELEEGAPLARDPAYALRYYLVYHMAFASLFAASLLMIRLCRMQGISLSAALIGSILFLLLLPYLQSIGGYYYDLGELFFMVAYLVLLLDRRWRLACIPLAVLATLNKESFLFFIITTVPLCLIYGAGLRGLLRDRIGLFVSATAAAASAVTHAAMVPVFAHAAGGETQFWLYKNLFFYLDPRSLFGIEQTYGLFAFAGYSPVTLALLIGIAIIGLPRLPVPVRAYAAASLLVSLPLFLLFAYPGEMRNLSFLFPLIVLCLGATFERLLARGDPAVPAQDASAG